MTYEEVLKILQASEQECYKNGYDVEKALKIAKEAIEKQIPQMITEIHCDEYYCPCCGAENNCDEYVINDRFCPNCGQRLDWSE